MPSFLEISTAIAFGFLMGTGLAAYQATWPWILGALIIITLCFLRSKTVAFCIVCTLIGWRLTVFRQKMTQRCPSPSSSGWVTIHSISERTNEYEARLLYGSGRCTAAATLPRFPTLLRGQSLRIEGTFQIIESPELRDWQHNTMWEYRTITVENSGIAPPLSQVAQYVREAVSKTLPQPEAGFLLGLLTGERSSMSKSLTNDLRTTGTTHLVAISGANITILLSALGHVLPGSLKVRALWTIVIGSTLSLLTGRSASVVRGAAVAIIGSLVRIRGTPSTPTMVILFPLTITALVQPFSISDIGLQLSYAAFCGLLFLGKRVQLRLEKLFGKNEIIPVFSETFAASLATAPVSFIHFGMPSLLGLLVNPLILAGIPLATGVGALSVTFHQALGSFELFRILAWAPLHTCLSIIRWSADNPLSISALATFYCVTLFLRARYSHNTIPPQNDRAKRLVGALTTRRSGTERAY